MINKALRLIRQFHEITQSELARRLEISKEHLCAIESGKKVADQKILNKYSEMFDIPVASLIFFSETIRSKNNDVTLSENIRTMFAGKILDIMEWIVLKNERSEVKV